MKHTKNWMVFAVALMIASTTWAADDTHPAKLQLIVEQQTELQRQLEAGIEGLLPRQVSAIRRAQAEVFAIVQGKADLDDLSIDEKVRLENALERIGAQLAGTTAAQDAQQQCWRERETGSKRYITRCASVSERDQERAGARAWMEKPKVCVPPGCGI